MIKGVRVRLQHIDDLNKKQPFEAEVKTFLLVIVFGKTVEVKYKSKSRYRRYLGVIFPPDGRYVNKEVVKAGFAWHFKKYSKDLSYDRLEKQARSLKR